MLLVHTFFVHLILAVSKSHPTLPELQTYPANGFTVHGNPYFGNLGGHFIVNLEVNKAVGLFLHSGKHRAGFKGAPPGLAQ